MKPWGTWGNLACMFGRHHQIVGGNGRVALPLEGHDFLAETLEELAIVEEREYCELAVRRGGFGFAGCDRWGVCQSVSSRSRRRLRRRIRLRLLRIAR